MLLYAVTDRAWTGKLTLKEQVEGALKGGATCVQLREKDMDFDKFLREAVEIGALCRSYGVPFIVNDNVEIAVRANADGVHVGQDDMSASEVRARVGDGMIIGVSVHDADEARKAAADGADYLGAGAVFSTATKTDASCITNDALKDICSAVDIPVVAIGGISKKNIAQLAGSGVAGVAVVSAIFATEDTQKAAAELLELSRKTAY